MLDQTEHICAIDWRPSASRQILLQRAELLKTTRNFFTARAVLEVETPFLVNSAVTDVNLSSASVILGAKKLFLHTSPEYAMKRLLAAGSGDIYQLCHVVRADEKSALHNDEFMLLEWYRCDFKISQLIDEVAELLNELMLSAGSAPRSIVRQTYSEAFQKYLSIDPLNSTDHDLLQLARARGLAGKSHNRDELLDFLISTQIGPKLGKGHWLALTHYPASQAALAQLDPNNPAVGLRFEFYGDGIELANGFEELASASEQTERFNRDNAVRATHGQPTYALDTRFLGALKSGLPPCAGVALGFDRTVMLACGATTIAEVMAFTTDQA